MPDAKQLRRELLCQQDNLCGLLQRTKDLQRKNTELHLERDGSAENLEQLKQDMTVRVMRQVAVNESLEAANKTMQGQPLTESEQTSVNLFGLTGSGVRTVGDPR